MKSYWRLLIALAALVLLASCTPPPPPGIEEVRRQLGEVLRGDVTTFQLQEIDVPQLAEGLEAGRVVLPLADRDNQVVELELPAQSVQLRSADLTEGIFKSDDEVQRVQLPLEQNWRLGECVENVEEAASCGALTIMDEDQTMVSGMVIHAELGLTFLEPVDLLLGGREHTGLHILYNVTGTEQIDVGKGEEPEVGAIGAARGGGLARPDTQAQLVFRETSIVLDGDVKFYEINKPTVWSRQEAAFNTASFVYGLIEPLSIESPETAVWGLDLSIKGQEVWVSGGPTTTNGDDLIDELTDPNYFLLTPVNDKELHYLFLGYAMSGGLRGQAAGIGTAAAGFGGGAGENHAFGDARSTTSLKARWVLMAHEIGHLLGGTHGNGVLNGCTAFLFFINICGMSIMPQGSAGAPETRQGFFSDANDANIAPVLTNALP